MIAPKSLASGYIIEHDAKERSQYSEEDYSIMAATHVVVIQQYPTIGQIISIIGIFLAAFLSAEYLIKSFHDDLDMKSSNQADQDETKWLRACITSTRRIGVSYLMMFLALLTDTIVSSFVVRVIAFAIIIVGVVIVYREHTLMTLATKRRKEELLEEMERLGEQLKQH